MIFAMFLAVLSSLKIISHHKSGSRFRYCCRIYCCPTIFTIIEFRVIPHLAAWRSDDEGVGIGKMLIRLWRETEASMRVARDEFGGIADPTAPLAGDEQRKQTRRAQVRVEVR